MAEALKCSDVRKPGRLCEQTAGVILLQGCWFSCSRGSMWWPGEQSLEG